MKTSKPKIFTVLLILAPIMLTIGIILIVFGTVVYPETFNGHSVAPNPAYFVPGILLVFFSIPMFFAGLMPSINKTMIKTMKYIQEENKDDLKSMSDTGADIASGGITKAAEALKKGFKDTKYCKYCGEQIDADSVFCNKCGGKQ